MSHLLGSYTVLRLLLLLALSSLLAGQKVLLILLNSEGPHRQTPKFIQVFWTLPTHH